MGTSGQQAGADRFQNVLLVLSYGVVIFSLLVQGLTIPRLARRATAAAEAQGAA